jgi:hypothetical protein
LESVGYQLRLLLFKEFKEFRGLKEFKVLLELRVQ